MEPDWDDFKALLALARGCSVAAAARALGVDNSTVSRRLAALEDAVGARLLVRGGREFSWTSEGRATITAAEAIEAAVTQGLRTCRAAGSDASGSIPAHQAWFRRSPERCCPRLPKSTRGWRSR